MFGNPNDFLSEPAAAAAEQYEADVTRHGNGINPLLLPAVSLAYTQEVIVRRGEQPTEHLVDAFFAHGLTEELLLLAAADLLPHRRHYDRLMSKLKQQVANGERAAIDLDRVRRSHYSR